ncbi:zinc-dependent metalloprotease [Flavobacterium sp. GT3R68]|uniref:zinc-dependent metalloprotease n=1 Tax=Flavobacterium sp. GT3R68 TaxID=2594437 RepID=UPI000F8648EB|nr:zinc-dependent metalloprotease [Flavobacterium sp. GT3R68]RTY90880.1 T9SS type A sorting domain-containing protein [Flavobacterium sp. GSN2]TRW93872.1 T9SS type A sorting domain-containing protein [Flavobacterium sp. GT3R68]
MKKTLLFLSLSIFTLGQVTAQTNKYWTMHRQGSDKMPTAKGVARLSFPVKFDLYDVNIDPLRQALFSTVNSTSKNSVVISLPNVKGDLEQFEMYEASNFEPALQAQFPEIRAYSGRGITDKYATVKLSISPQGIQTMVFRTDKENEFMEPYSQDGKVYAVFNSSRQKGKLAWSCSTDDKNLIASVDKQLPSSAKSSAGQLKTMRLAQSCNGEYAAYFGATTAGTAGDKALVMSAFNATLTRCNGVYEKDLALHLNLVASTTNVIFCNPATDPYSATLGNWNAELQNTLSSSLTGAATSLAANNAAYDIGHMFGATGGGGNAGCIGCVCTDDTASTTDQNKGSGITSPADGIPMGDNFDIDYVVHEVGHQLGGNHTFSNSNEGSGVSKEVGSGVTIMGYAGITSQDVAPHSIDIYHQATIAQIQTNLGTKSCPVTTNIAANNATPVANAGADITIPKSTPFMLTGSATDANSGDALTYCWEQNNDGGASTGANSVASVTKTVGPNFTSWSPTASPTRYFPQMATILANSQTTAGTGNDGINVEALSSVARTLAFRLTVRDNAPYSATAPIKVGQTAFDDMAVTVDATKGPFDVTSQNVDGISWVQGTTQTITWTVNGTNTMTGAANVDILLSSDNGATYSTVLVANTPNDGTEAFTVPNVAFPFCRIMVKPTGNVFFDVNAKTFAIGYTVTSTTICTDYTRTFSPPQAMTTGWTGYGIPVTDNYIITDANFQVVATAARTNQVSIGLGKPGTGNVDMIMVDANCTNAKVNLNAVFDDEGAVFNCNATATGAAYIPVNALSSADGMSSLGTWSLAAKSTLTTNTLTSATLTLCRVDTTTTLLNQDFGLAEFSLYPNPNKGNFTIQFNSATNNDVNISVHDISGRRIFDKKYNNTGMFTQNLQLNNVQTGVYVVTVQDGDSKVVKRIVVE